MPDPNPFLLLERNARDDPRGLFLRTADDSITNADAVILAKQIAFELRRLGLAAGDVVAIDLPDRLGALFTWAVYHEAAISTVLPPGTRPDAAVPVRWLVSNHESAQHGDARSVHVDARFLQLVSENPYGIRPSEAAVDTLRIVFSSGTTGTPKAMAMGRHLERVFGAALPSWFAGGPVLSLMDLGTAAGIGELYLAVTAGQPYLCAGGAAPAEIIRLIRSAEVATLKGSPHKILALLDELEAEGGTLPSLTTVAISGTSMPAAAAERLRRSAPGCTVRINYGSTEAGGATSRRDASDDPADVGHPVPGTVLEIVDDRDQPVDPGTEGWIRYRSPGMAHGYLGDPEASARAFRDGWFHPGDRGVLRADGGLTLRTRTTDLLNA
ncbi:long-chain fatty acid--CoA ligase, partial [Schumannella luteola]